MHPRNKHQGSYNFKELKKVSPSLTPYVRQKVGGGLTIDFADPKAVKELNRALLKSYYQLSYWDIPENYLCPPIPGRAEYIHLMADRLKEEPRQPIRCLDIGTGANLIYPIIGVMEYDWQFVAADIDQKAIENVRKIVKENPELESKIDIRKQPNPRDIFRGIVKEGEYFDLMFCNPPFYESAREAEEATQQKAGNLKTKNSRNFGGQGHELWCQGGEKKFINDIGFQSKFFKDQVGWFSTLVSKKENLRDLYKTLKKTGAEEVETISLDLGNKKSRIVAWTYQNHKSGRIEK